MTASDWIALAGLILLAVTSAATVYGVLNGRISGHVAKLHEKVEEVKRDYVRRDDLRDLMQDIKGDVQRIERGQENVSSKLDQMTMNTLPVLARVTEPAASMAAATKGN